MCITAYQILGMHHASSLLIMVTWFLSGTVNSVLLNFLLVCLFLYFCSTVCLMLALRTCLKVLFSLICFLQLYSWFYHLLLVGFKHPNLHVNFIHVRRVLNSVTYCRERTYPFPDTSVWEHTMFLFMLQTLYSMCFFSILIFLCLLWLHPQTTLLGVWANTLLLLFLLQPLLYKTGT